MTGRYGRGLPFDPHRGKRGEIVKYAWVRYHAGQITFAELCHVLFGVGGYRPDTRNDLSDSV